MMIAKERVLCSLSWQDPDRVPIQVYLTPEVQAELEMHFNGQGLLTCLGVDFRNVEPHWTQPLGQRQLPGQRCTRVEENLDYDLWGAGYRHVNYGNGYYDEAVYLPLAELHTMQDVADYPWPSPDNYEYSGLSAQCELYKDYAIILGSAGIPDILNGISRGRGMTQVMLDIATRDEVGLAIIDKRVDFYYEVLRRSLEATGGKVDIVQLGEDTGNQNGRMFSPRDFKEIFRPRLQKFYDLAHEFGAKAMMHSCGDTHDLMPTFIEMGLDILDAMQPEPKGMEPEKIRALCRGKLAFCGLISTQQTLPFGSEAQCRTEARHRLDVIAKGGGYIFAPAHCIQPGTPLQNVLAIYEEALGHKL